MFYEAASYLQSTVSTDENGKFLMALYFAFFSGPWSLYTELALDWPAPDRWFFLQQIICNWFLLSALHWVVHLFFRACIPDDIQYTWMALPRAYARFLAQQGTWAQITFLGMVPLGFFAMAVRWIRDTTKTGASSSPRAIWIYWCYECHWLWLGLVAAAMGEPNGSILSFPTRYVLGVAILAFAYRVLSLCSRDEWRRMLFASALPILAHNMARFSEEALQDMGLTRLQAYLVWHGLVMVPSFFLDPAPEDGLAQMPRATGFDLEKGSNEEKALSWVRP